MSLRIQNCIQASFIIKYLNLIPSPRFHDAELIVFLYGISYNKFNSCVNIFNDYREVAINEH